MYVGVCRLTLHLYDNQSLKGKRRVLHSLTDTVRRKFGVSAAEVDNQDKWQLATVGLAAVSGDHATAQALIDRAVNHIIESTPEAEVTGTEVDVFTY